MVMTKLCNTCGFWAPQSDAGATVRGRCQNDESPRCDEITEESDTCEKWAYDLGPRSVISS